MNNRTNEIIACTALTEGTYCGADLHKGKTYGPVNLPLCTLHAAQHFTFYTQTYRNNVLGELEKAGTVSHTPGLTYVIELPNSRIKIGTTRDAGTLVTRWKSISREYQAEGHEGFIEPLAVLEGGASLEASLHNRFRHLRIDDEFGEQFRAEPELTDYALAEGIPAHLNDAVTAYEQWRDQRRSKRELSKALEAAFTWNA
ncbi:hypothetical protein ACFWPP_08385 [Streptomyces anulatus]|uniref:hypothetical protein n=1 Tax=Streptomyces anulatus TaxID=1892 RepID=UPI003658DFB1